MHLDRIDVGILRVLQKNARIMNKRLASEVGLAASSCHERVKRLWSDGIVVGTHTMLDARKLGYGLSAVLFVNISKQGQLNIDGLMRDLVSIPEIQDVYLVTGRYDLVVTLIARDMDHLKQLAYNSLSKREEITGYETSIAYDHLRGWGVPLAEDEASG